MTFDKSKRLGRAAGWFLLAIVLVLAIAVRVWYFKDLDDSPFFGTLFGQASANVSTAKAIAESGSLGDEPLLRPVLYPWLLSLISHGGENPTTPRQVQAAMGVALVALVFIAGSLLFGRGIALLAALACALYGPCLYWEGQLEPACLMVFTLACCWVVAIYAGRRGSLLLWGLAGLLLGVTAALRFGAFVIILPALLLAGSRAWSPPRGGRRLVPIVLIVCALVPALPAVIHNARMGEVGSALDGGIEFYVANNAMSGGVPPSTASKAGWWNGRDYAVIEAQAESGRLMGPSDASAYWFLRGAKFVLTEPASYLKLLGKKLALFWGPVEVVEGASPSFVAGRWIPWSLHLMRAFVFLGPLALAGLVICRRGVNCATVLFPLSAALVLGLLYTPTASTRVLALPSLALLGAAYVFELARTLRHARWRQASLAVAPAAAAVLIVNWVAPWASGARPEPARDHRMMGLVYEIQGNASAAFQEYGKAVRLAPDDPLSHIALGGMLVNDGILDQAERHYARAAILDTLSATPFQGLATVYMGMGKPEAALSALEQALIKAPYHVGAACVLGDLCIELGLYEQAEDYFRFVQSLDPGNIRAIDGLLDLRDRGIHVRMKGSEAGLEATLKGELAEAMEYLRRGDMDASKALLDEARRKAPDDINVVYAYSTWNLVAGNTEEAIAGYEKCLERNPRNTVVLNNLAGAYHAVGRVDEAIASWRRLLELDPQNAKARANLDRALAEHQ
jgi:tetratricopeptide (TPR) repeat protein